MSINLSKLTLWDLLPRILRPSPSKPGAPGTSGRAARAPVRKPAQRARVSEVSDSGAQARYDAVVRESLAAYGIKVRKWRSSMTGIAWEVRYRDGSKARFIESPRPKGPMSAAVFLHEVGHHAIGFGVYRPRCLEEYHAWAWSLAEMERRGLNITDSVRRRMHQSLHYAIAKAMRRGLRTLPPELEPYREPAGRAP